MVGRAIIVVLVTLTACDGGVIGTGPVADDGGTPMVAPASASASAGTCNGLDDEGCACDPSTEPEQACYTGAGPLMGIGQCQPGKQLCEKSSDEFGTWGVCTGSVMPGTEDCADGIDNDCNGAVDDGPGCACKPGATRSCYTGPAATRYLGQCKDGTQTCNASGTDWSQTCDGEVLPGTEDCADGIDNDCNGVVDDGAGCICKPGETRACYTGPASTRGVGTCKDGVQTCDATGTAWSQGCAGEVLPGGEVCDDNVDNDCDGQVDEDCIVTVNVNINGDCVWAKCPSNAPYIVGCNITMGGKDCRGCVANSSGSSKVYFQEGNDCGSGSVKGQLYCSSKPGSKLNSSNCPINKKYKYYESDPDDCPDLGSGGTGC